MPNLFYPSLMTLRTSVKSYQSRQRSIVVLVCVLLASMILAGCGQKGALYLPEDAPGNSKYIFYGNDSDSDSDSDKAKAANGDGQDNYAESGAQVSDDPQDY